MVYRMSLLLALLLACEAVLAAGQETPSTRDWHQAGEIARASGSPVLAVFTAEDCGYCERLKSKVLRPLRENSASGSALVVCEYRTNTEGKVRDFDGTKTRARSFLRRYDIFAVPTVLLLDANGRPLGEPIVGFDDAANYRRLLQAKLEMAQGILRQATPSKTLHADTL